MIRAGRVRVKYINAGREVKDFLVPPRDLGAYRYDLKIESWDGTQLAEYSTYVWVEKKFWPPRLGLSSRVVHPGQLLLSRGEVWWHEPPDEKPRPVLILTRDDVISRALDVIAMPASRTTHDWLTEVELGPDDGMPTTCFRIAELDAARMETICRALATATSCS